MLLRRMVACLIVLLAGATRPRRLPRSLDSQNSTYHARAHLNKSLIEEWRVTPDQQNPTHAAWAQLNRSLSEEWPTARTQRTQLYDAFASVYEVMHQHGVEVFPRNGFLIMVARDHGFSRWDMDVDMAILDTNCEKLRSMRDAISATGSSLEITGEDACGRWQVTRHDLPWPVMDGHTWATQNGYTKPIDIEDRFPVSDWALDQPLMMKFYCTDVALPRGYETYLSAKYGESWRDVAINKCSKPDGPLYKIDSKHCESCACYNGALSLPVASRPGVYARGGIDSEKCTGFSDEPPFEDADAELAKEMANMTTEPWLTPWAKTST
eukprot:TRINITY_DN32969_c0_g1_i1.p1 TRINITY_DN32969_c0_g1~~TRINITY_DN32969_c0_g1_i1.p1  ORF type:complete len:324 (-),score=16.01 TRINITY_DN32969_c0_g1_i1:224-1195(-)